MSKVPLYGKVFPTHPSMGVDTTIHSLSHTHSLLHTPSHSFSYTHTTYKHTQTDTHTLLESSHLVLLLSLAYPGRTTLETTQRLIDDFLSHLPFRCYLPEVASVRD